MRIAFRIYVDIGNNLFTRLEHPAYYDTKDEVALAFRDCFYYHLGRRPSERQVEGFLNLGNVTARSRGLTYHFIID